MGDRMTPTISRAGRPRLGKVKKKVSLTKNAAQAASKKACSLGMDLSAYIEQLVRKDNADKFAVGTIGGIAA